jgi:hypothetical protein
MDTALKHIDLGYLARSAEGDCAMEQHMLMTLLREVPVELARLRTRGAASD